MFSRPGHARIEVTMADHKQDLQRLYPQYEQNYPRLAAIFTVEDPELREKLLKTYLDQVQAKENSQSVA